MKTTLAIASTALVLSMGATAHAQGRPLSARVHIDGSPGAVLEAYDAPEWRFACVAPCDARVPLAPAYRISGPDIEPSKAFSLVPEGDAHLSVNAGSRGLHVLGVLLVPLGASSVALSLGLLIVGSIKYACSDCIDGLADTTMVNWGWGLLAGGLVGLVAGVTLIQTTRTKVTLWGEPTPYVNLQDVALVREKRMTPNNALGWPLFAVSF
jgi:hypothetical protein